MQTEEKQYIRIKNPENETKCGTRGMSKILKDSNFDSNSKIFSEVLRQKSNAPQKH